MVVVAKTKAHEGTVSSATAQRLVCMFRRTQETAAIRGGGDATDRGDKGDLDSQNRAEKGREIGGGGDAQESQESQDRSVPFQFSKGHEKCDVIS